VDGGSRVAEVLRAHGVPFLFTLCGGHISPILVGAKRVGVRVVDVRHEVNAVFAADAVARMTGIPGVAAVTAGPGVTNAITALKNAQMAQSPVVLLGGATATVLRGRGSLQDIDQRALVKPHVKFLARPNTVREIVPAMEEAFARAQEGVPGPVFVELAVDLLYAESTIRDWYKAKTDRPPRNLQERAVQTYLKAHLANQFFGGRRTTSEPRSVKVPTATDKALSGAVDALARADRPVLLLGSQALVQPQRASALVAAIERLGIPTFLSGMGRGLLGKGHPLQLRHARKNALKEADVIVLAGVPADFRLDYGAHFGKGTLVSVNRSRVDLLKNRKPDVAIEADPLETLVALADRVPGRDRAAWIATLRGRDDARDAEIAQMAKAPAPPINPLEVCLGVERHLSDHSALVVDGGDFVASASYVVRPRKPASWLDPGVFGTLGVGAGFALGAKLVHPESDVWLLYGDGSVGFSIAEFDTFVRHGLPVLAVVGNDAGWTQIARDQVDLLGDDVGTVLRHTEYAKVAEGFGAAGWRLDDPTKIDEVLSQALAATRAGRPALVDAIIGKTEFRKGSLSM
jgi:acetolactate synthase-like protein